MSLHDKTTRKNVLAVSAVVVVALAVGLFVTDHRAHTHGAALSATSITSTSDSDTSDSSGNTVNAGGATPAANPLVVSPKNKVSPGVLASGATSGVNSDGISTLQDPPTGKGSSGG